MLEEDPQTIPRDSHANDALLTAIGWKPCGRLLAVVPNAHDGPLTDMCYLQRVFEHESSSLPRGTTSSSFWGTLATCGTDGTLRLWAVAGHGRSPLELLVTVEVSTRGVGIGHARSVSWDRSGTTIALGTAGNAVCLVQPGTVRTSKGARYFAWGTFQPLQFIIQARCDRAELFNCSSTCASTSWDTERICDY